MEMVDNFKVELKAWNEESVTAAGKYEFLAKLQTIDGGSGIDYNLDLGEPQYQLNLTQQGRALGFTRQAFHVVSVTSVWCDIVQQFQPR